MSAQPSQSKVVIVLTTLPKDNDNGEQKDLASRISKILVEERLVACVSALPGLTSTYRWEGKVCSEGEQLLIIKTIESNLDKLEKRLAQLHPYKTFEFLVVPSQYQNQSYLNWVIESCQSQV